MVINMKHHDLEIVYAIRFQHWLQADKRNEQRKSQLLAVALENLKHAHYTPEDIQAIERNARRQLAAVGEKLDANRDEEGGAD